MTKKIDFETEKVIARQKLDATLGMLKDFQKETVTRVMEMFDGENASKRVLVSDEVGLGKTFIARGIVDSLRMKFVEEKKEGFKVAYICGNQVIAEQNLSRLGMLGRNSEGSSTRLSMQHLYIALEDINSNEEYTKSLALSPNTSFRLKGLATGTKDERALMFLVLNNLGLFNQSDIEKIKNLFCDPQNRGYKMWSKQTIDYYNEKIIEIEKAKPASKYLSRYHVYFKGIAGRIHKIINNETGEKIEDIIISLRKKFATISADMMNVDLVIMDEFQRFPDLINTKDKDSDLAIIVNKFLKIENKKDAPFVLLLSATPYKPYQTSDEDGENVSLKEFKQVTTFLSDEKAKDFDTTWERYTGALKNINQDNKEQALEIKTEAENKLYGIMCRTERLSAGIKNDYIKTHKPILPVSNDDIASYVDVHDYLHKLDLGEKDYYLPVEYTENVPYLLSFLTGYKIYRDNISKRYKPLNGFNYKRLVIKKSQIDEYKDIKITNAKMKKALEITGLPDNKTKDKPDARMLLWVPPSFSYYKLGKPFDGNLIQSFSKTLIFSSWVMVPRSVSSILSYIESKDLRDELKKSHTNKKNYWWVDHYFGKEYANKSKDGKTRFQKYNNLIDYKDSKNHINLVYPSRTASDLWSLANDKKGPSRSLNDLKQIINKEIVHLLNDNLSKYIQKEKEIDISWYYLAFPLLDCFSEAIQIGGRTVELQSRINELTKTVGEVLNGQKQLGCFPSDLSDYLTKLVIGAPGICFFRQIPNAADVFQIASNFINCVFDNRESICILNSMFTQINDIDEKILEYCSNGCIQSVIDEYIYMLTSDNPSAVTAPYKGYDKLYNLNITASIINSFYSGSSIRVNYINSSKKKGKNNSQGFDYYTIRLGYAACFAVDTSKEENIDPAINIRQAFNSPFKPFVLTSTSVGQEGLDFHFYCRRIVHWNLPNNPIDFEQREGRIDRYKNLYIRQQIAYKHKDEMFEGDVWKKMFEMEWEALSLEDKKSGLIPYWSYKNGDESSGIEMERHVMFYPHSRDLKKYDNLMTALSYYRLTIGQPRQEELLYSTLKQIEDKEYLKKFFINLSPWTRTGDK